MKVVWVIHGPNKIYLNIAKELAKLCDLYLIICDIENFYQGNQIYKSIYLKFYSNYAPLFRKLLGTDFPILTYYKKFNKTLNEINPDVVISLLSFMPSSFQALKWAKKHNKKFILQMELKKKPLINNLLWKIIKSKLNQIIKKSDMIQAWSQDVIKYVKKEFKIKDIKLLNPSIDINLYKEKKIYKNENKLLIVSRLVPYKNHKHLIDACKKLKDNKIDFNLKIVGSGPLKEEIISYIKEKKLEKEIIFETKYYKFEEMYKLYQNHDILILPSYNEAIGMVVPEAMASGVACIVSDTSGAKDYIKDKENGLIFKTGNIDDLYEKILYLLNNRSKIEEFGKKARKHIIENYITDKITKKFYNQINEVIKK